MKKIFLLIAVALVGGCLNCVFAQCENFDVTATFDENVSCYLAYNGNATVIATGGTSPYNWYRNGLPFNNQIYPSYDSSDPTVSYNAMGLGTWLIAVIDGNECYAEFELVVDESEVPAHLELEAELISAACNGEGGSAEAIQGNNDFTMLNYWWFDTNCYSGGQPLGLITLSGAFELAVYANCSLGDTQTISDLPPGEYTVWVEYWNGSYTCYDWAYVLIPESGFTVALTTCLEIGCYDHDSDPATIGQGLIDVTVAPTGTYTYSWVQTEDPIDDDNNIDVSTNTPYTGCTTATTNQQDLQTMCGGIWTLTVTDENDCEVVTGFDCLVEPLLRADVSGYNNPYDLTGSNATIDITSSSADLPAGDEVHIGDHIHLAAGSGIWYMDDNLVEFAYDKYLRAVASVTSISELEAINTTFINLCTATWWRGLEIQGDKWYEGSNPNYTNNVSSIADLENCTITGAFTGIRNHPVPTWNVSSMSTSMFNATGWGTSYGGMIEADDCTFFNNMRDVNLCGTKQSVYEPYFNTCTFQIDDDIFDVPSGWSVPAQFRRERVFLSMGVRHPHFHNCYFINDAIDLLEDQTLIGLRVFTGAGFTFDNPDEGLVTGFTCGLLVEGNIVEPYSTFSASTWNILANNTDWIDNVEFSCYRDIYIEDVINALVYRCTFDFLPSDYPVTIGGWGDGDWNDCTDVPYYGLYIDGDMPYEVGLNTFNGTDLVDCNYGFVANNNGGNQNRVFQNTFNDFESEDNYAMSLQGINKGSNESIGLHYTCNDFDNCRYDVSVIGSSTQGVATPQQGADADHSAGNDFSSSLNNTDSDYEQIWDEAEGHTYRYASGDAIVLGELSPSVTDELVGNEGACDEDPEDPGFAPGGGGEESFAQSNEEYNSAKEEWLELVDGGDTEALTEEVINTTFAEALTTYYELMSMSPNLSEQVLLETIENEYELPNVLVKQILASNPQAAKSAEVRQRMEDKLTPFDEYQDAEIMEGLEWVGAKEELEFEMAAYLLERSLAFNDLRHEIESNPEIEDKVNTLIGYLQPSGIISDAYLAAAILLQAGNVEDAISTLENIVLDFELTPSQLAELENYIELVELQYVLAATEEPVLTTGQFDNLENIFSSSAGKDGSLALSLLKQYGDYAYDEPLRKRNPNAEFRGMEMTLANLPAFTLYPNPAKDMVVFGRINSAGELRLEVLDVTGRIVLTETMNDGEGEIMMDVRTLASGTYLLNAIDEYGSSVHANAIAKE